MGDDDDFATTFGFLHDREFGGSTAIVCVAAPIDAVTAAVARREGLAVEADVYGRPVGRGTLAFQYAGQPCTVIVRRAAPDYLAELSAELGATIGAFEYEKVSDWEQLRVYADGRCVETYAYGIDYSDEMEGLAEELGEAMPTAPPTDDGKPFDHRIVADGNEVRFRSERRTVAAERVAQTEAMLDEAAKFHGLVFPHWDRMPAERKGTIGGLTRAAFARVDVLRPRQLDAP